MLFLVRILNVPRAVNQDGYRDEVVRGGKKNYCLLARHGNTHAIFLLTRKKKAWWQSREIFFWRARFKGEERRKNREEGKTERDDFGSAVICFLPFIALPGFLSAQPVKLKLKTKQKKTRNTNGEMLEQEKKNLAGREALETDRPSD